MRRADSTTKSKKLARWPTLLLAVGIYFGWAAAVWFHNMLPIWALIPIGAWIVAWHGSLQHETIHGHPTGNRRFNALLGSLPLALWLPYRCYQRDHIAHHATDEVTHPTLDPESRYLLDRIGSGGAVRRALAVLQASLIGRLLLGPFDLLLRFYESEIRRFWQSPGIVLGDWAPHLLGLAFVELWLWLSHMSFALYLVTFVYPGTALSLLRSFAEHRAARQADHRIAVVENAGPFALLFLNNNLHAAHHRAPGVPWFELPAFYRRHRAEIVRDNGGLVYKGYGEIARRFAFRPHDTIVHPFA